MSGAPAAADPRCGRCHCGAVSFRLAAPPTELGSCNCSICRRTGALFAYCGPREVAVEGESVAYVQGDRLLALHHCGTCGCTTHWTSLDPALDRMAVNARLIDGLDLESIPIRKIDGASF